MTTHNNGKRSINFYCFLCSSEAEPFYHEPLLSKDECDCVGDPIELDTCPAHGDSKDLRVRVKLPKKHPMYVPKGRVLRWKSDGEDNYEAIE